MPISQTDCVNTFPVTIMRTLTTSTAFSATVRFICQETNAAEIRFGLMMAKVDQLKIVLPAFFRIKEKTTS